MEMTYSEAWRDFYDNYISKPEQWSQLTEPQRRRIKDAERDYHEIRKNKEGRILRLGYDRAKDILSTYAPGRYEFLEQVILKD